MGKLVVYTTDTCANCAMVKTYLTAKKVEFEVVNLSKSPERQEEAIKISGAMRVPIITNGVDVLVGWQPSKMANLISA